MDRSEHLIFGFRRPTASHAHLTREQIRWFLWSVVTEPPGMGPETRSLLFRDHPMYHNFGGRYGNGRCAALFVSAEIQVDRGVGSRSRFVAKLGSTQRNPRNNSTFDQP